MIKALVTDVPESNFDVQDEGQVEIIGWLYQYYNEEPHNAVVNINGGAVKKNDIPAATQLFTTDWVVRYMVDNSLGRFYLEHNGDSTIAAKLEYLLPGELTVTDKQVNLDQIKILDNAMGSGHILVYAFDVLMEMYLEQGYSKRGAALSIIKNNLFGLEIDRRAYQIAYFALMMKLRQYHRRALTMAIVPNIFVFEDTDDISAEDIDALTVSPEVKQDLTDIAGYFANARTLGSIIKLDRHFDVVALKDALTTALNAAKLEIFGTSQKVAKLLGVLDIVDVLQTKYEVVVTNPPYLNRMDKPLKDYVKKHYKAYSGDLFSVFIWLNANMTVADGYSAYMTPMVWMFIKTFQALREALISKFEINSLIQMETHAFFDEAFVTIDSFVVKNTTGKNLGTYIRLTEFTGGMEVQREKVVEAIQNHDVEYMYRTNQTNFENIPGSPIAYWANTDILSAFTDEIGGSYPVAAGISTGKNEKYLRLWHEVNFEQMGVSFFPLAKGGKFHKWSGNRDYVIHYDTKSLEEMKRLPGFRHDGNKFYFKRIYSWSKITSAKFNARLYTQSVFDSAAPAIIDAPLTVLGFINSKASDYFLELINPTINFPPGYISSLPIPKLSHFVELKVTRLVSNSIKIVDKNDASFVENIEFKVSPVLRHFTDHKQPPPPKTLTL